MRIPEITSLNVVLSVVNVQKKIKMSLMSYTNVTKSGDFNDINNDKNDRNLIKVPEIGSSNAVLFRERHCLIK